MLLSPRYTPEQWESIQRQAQHRRGREIKRAARDARLNSLADRMVWPALTAILAIIIGGAYVRTATGPTGGATGPILAVGILFGGAWALGVYTFFRSPSRRMVSARLFCSVAVFPFRLVGWGFWGLWQSLRLFSGTSNVAARPLVGAAGLRGLRNTAYACLLAHWLFDFDLRMGESGAWITLGLAVFFGFTAAQVDALNLWLQARER